MKRVLSFLLILVMLLGMSPVLMLESDAAVGQISYVYGSTSKFKNVITNWGEREQTATFMSPNADAFYKAQGTNYTEMASLSGSSNRSSVPSSPLYKELQSIMKSAHKTTTSYDSTKELYKYTDCQKSSSSSISSFYSGTAIGPGWNEGPSWNREHTWPNSKGLGGADENDIMMLRPTATSENSSRGNTAYGESDSYYHPNSESGGKYDLRGDVARIMLYTYVRWGNTGKMWGTSGVMESETVLLKWMEEDPVDTWELGRNDSVESITGTRNVFVDYPELAFLMFGTEIPEDMPTPSGAAASGEVIPTVPTEPTEPTEPTPPDYVLEPQTGVPYKFRVVQKNVDKTLYITGEMNGYYFATTEDINQAADVYLEAVSGGYRLFMLKDGVKTYLEIIKNGTYTNVVFTTSPTKTLKWNDAIKSVTCDVDGTDYYFGNYSEYVTLSASKISYVTGNNATSFDETNFVAHFIATDGEELPDVPTEPTEPQPTEPQPTEPEPTEPQPTEPTTPVIPDYVTEPETGKPYKFYVDQKTVGKVLYITGEMNGYYFATTEDVNEAADVFFESVSGGYRLYILKDGVKNYLEIVKSDTHTNVVYVTTPTKTLKWNSEIASVTCDVEGADHYFGTYKSFVTFSASNISYVTGEKASAFDTTSFVGHFLDVGGETPDIPTEPTEPEPTEPEPTEPQPTEPVIPSQGTYEKITAANQLVTGKYVLIADSGYAPGVLDGTWLSAVQPAVNGDSVTDTKGAVWTLTVSGDSVTMQDANGVFVAPKGGNTNGIKEGEYSWAVSFEQGAFRFAGTGSDTVLLASNVGSDNMFRAYKTTTVSGSAEDYPSYFTLYKLVDTQKPPEDKPERIPGDIDGNETVNTEDVVALLLHISMPDMFELPEGVSADFTGDALVTTDDAVKLLLHISMPDMFPL